MLQIRDDKLPIQPAVVSAVRKTWFSPQKCYILVGGLGGVGLELADWMLTRGARSLVLTSRSGPTTGYQKRRLRQWNDRGFNVHLSSHNVVR